MSDDYIDAKIAEALKATDGDKHNAQKLLITWAVRDQQLLLGFAKPHLKALVSARVEQATRVHGKSPDGKEKLDVDAILSTHTKGEKRGHVTVPPPKASARQASVMHKLADAFKKKK